MWISGSDSVDVAKEFLSRVFKIMSEAGLKLRKWVTNDPALRKFFASLNDETNQNVGIEKCKQVLGMEWNIVDDEFIYDFQKLLRKCDSMKLTKQNILSFAASFYLSCYSSC